MSSCIRIYTDGSCLNNGSPFAVGGWAAILENGRQQLRLSGREEPATSQRMELTAAIQALQALKKPTTVKLITDSQYLRRGCLEWLAQWKERGWLTAARKPVQNDDLWRRLDTLLEMHTVAIHWIKGHSGHPMNELADALARRACEGETVRSYGLAGDTVPPAFSAP